MNASGNTSRRIVIVGGGIAGLSIAVRLAQSGFPVTLLEASRLGVDASTRNQGWLHSGGIYALKHPDLAEKCRRSLAQTLRFCPDCLEPQHEGMAYLISKPDTLANPWVNAWETAEIAWREFDRDELFQQVPGLTSSEVQQAFLLPDRAFRPHILVTCMAAAAENAGAEIRTETTVVEVKHDEGNVCGVVTGTGEEIAARLVVIAGGTRGVSLCAGLNCAEAGRQSEFTIVPLKTHLVAIKADLSRLPFCVVDAGGFNHIPHAPTAVFGANRWLPVGNPTDQKSVPEEIDRIWQGINRFFPELMRDQYEVLEWAGTTIQAMHADQVEPGHAPRATVIDHSCESPAVANLMSVFPGRATLWASLAEQACELILAKLDQPASSAAATPPWGTSE